METKHGRLNRFSSQEEKNDAAEVVFELLSSYLFDKVNLLTNPTLITSTSVTSTTDYNVLFRIQDTSAGKFLRPDRKSRMRMNFYSLSNQSTIDAYILAPAIYLSDSAPTSVSQLDSYVGVKIYRGVLSLVAKDSQGERTVPTSVKILDDTTHIIDIIYNISSAEVIFDGTNLGTISCNLQENIYNLVTFYPTIVPVRSIGGSEVQITAETYQFLQDR